MPVVDASVCVALFKADVTEALAVRAAEIAAGQKIRGCDSIYVALAEQLEMELVTFDGQQLERAAAVVVTRTP